MSAIFQTCHHVLFKGIVQSHRICVRHYSALLKCHRKNHAFLNPNSVSEPSVCIQPHNKRDFIGWVKDKKDGYRTKKEESETAHLKYGLNMLKTELKLWTEEVKEHLQADPMMFCPPGNAFVCPILKSTYRFVH